MLWNKAQGYHRCVRQEGSGRMHRCFDLCAWCVLSVRFWQVAGMIFKERENHEREEAGSTDRDMKRLFSTRFGWCDRFEL